MKMHRWRKVGKMESLCEALWEIFFPLVTHPHSSCQAPEDLKKSYVVSYLISQDSSNNWLHFCRSKTEAAAAACLQTLLLSSDIACMLHVQLGMRLSHSVLRNWELSKA